MSNCMGPPQDATPAGAEPVAARGPDTGGASPGLAPFRHPSFGLFLLSRLCSVSATQMVSVAIGWQVYERTGDALALGLTGLAQFATMALLAPITGDAADRFDRRRLLAGCHAVFLACALALAWIGAHAELGVLPIYAVLAVIGAARAFWMPTGQALLPSLVPQAEFPRAVAWSAANFQVASIGAPALSGALLGLGGAITVYRVAAALVLVSLGLLASMRYRPEPRAPSGGGWRRLLAGVSYVRSQRVILGAISLDLFAVLLGGAVALMPIYARDILHAGATGLGLLRSAPALGAGMVGLWLAFRPIQRAAGRRMFACVALFGLATIVFGLSRSFSLSLVALVVLGGADMMSVVIRQTLVQISTPSEMRGRVAAVNFVFIGASNELGELESGATAAWFGTVPAVVVGGIGTLLVTALWMRMYPELVRIERLEDLVNEG
jgi:MFS family permease